MFGFIKKGKRQQTENTVETSKDITAIADGEIIDITKVNDEVFSQKLLGESTAMKFQGKDTVLCAPVDGSLSVMFPTGHAFGISGNNGAELLVHIGINTVEAEGKGFTPLKKQGTKVKAGEPVVRVNFDELSKRYDMSTMLIVTNSAEHPVVFKNFGQVQSGAVIGTFI